MKVDAKAQERLGAMIFYLIIGVLAYFVFRIFEPFIVPLAWAAVLVVVAHPIYDDLERRWGSGRAALACTLGVTLVLILPTIAVMYAFAQQGVGAVHAIQERAAAGRFAWVNHAWSDIQRRFPDLGSDCLRNFARMGRSDCCVRSSALRDDSGARGPLFLRSFRNDSVDVLLFP